jgi:hypothetical protein
MNLFRHKILLAALVSLALTGCASQPAPDSQDCVLGVPHAAEVMATAWGDPVDELISRSMEQGQGWSCPPAKRTPSSAKS